MALHRYYPTWDPSLGILAWNLGFPAPRAETVRIACVDLTPMAALAGAAQGAQILRVHDVAETRQALRLWQAINGSRT